jgi:hypothetical protein
LPALPPRRPGAEHQIAASAPVHTEIEVVVESADSLMPGGRPESVPAALAVAAAAAAAEPSVSILVEKDGAAVDSPTKSPSAPLAASVAAAGRPPLPPAAAAAAGRTTPTLGVPRGEGFDDTQSVMSEPADISEILEPMAVTHEAPVNTQKCLPSPLFPSMLFRRADASLSSAIRASV